MGFVTIYFAREVGYTMVLNYARFAGPGKCYVDEKVRATYISMMVIDGVVPITGSDHVAIEAVDSASIFQDDCPNVMAVNQFTESCLQFFVHIVSSVISASSIL